MEESADLPLAEGCELNSLHLLQVSVRKESVKNITIYWTDAFCITPLLGWLGGKFSA